MLSQAHIVYISVGNFCLRHKRRVIPKSKIVCTIWTLGYSKRIFCQALPTSHQQIFAIVFYSTGIEYALNTKPLNKIRVGLRVKVVTPEHFGRAMVRDIYNMVMPLLFSPAAGAGW